MDIRGICLSCLRHNIGVVFQEALLFNRSIAENLQVGKPEATEAEMREVCRRAQVLDIIERNPEGFNATVGERGRLLSGGERQRLSIARALLKDPPILILDEATSSLDAITEAKIQAALDEVMKGRTTFVIAHRLATVRNATRILVFQDARIIESGTFDELVRLGGHFAELAKTQFMVPDTALGLAAQPTATPALSHAGTAAQAPAPPAEPPAAGADQKHSAAEQPATDAAAVSDSSAERPTEQPARQPVEG
jgi:ATP-binding cassette subfamily B protein